MICGRRTRQLLSSKGPDPAEAVSSTRTRDADPLVAPCASGRTVALVDSGRLGALFSDGLAPILNVQP